MVGLAAARKGLHITQDALARVAGINRVTVSNIETGRTVPNKPTRRKVESALRLLGWAGTAADLWGGEGQ